MSKEAALKSVELPVSAGATVSGAGIPGAIFDVVLTPAAADATLTLKDGPSGAIVLTLFAKATTNSLPFNSTKGLQCSTEIYYILAGAGALADVSYQV
jgi:hypothetical protein